MKIYLLILLPVFALTATDAQKYNPFKSIGKKEKIVTLSKGKYVEVFDYDTIQRIGTVLYNTKTKKIVRLLDVDKAYKDASDNTVSNRWYGIDPLSEKYYSYSPYTFALNNPVLFNDPDGRDVDPTHLKGETNIKAFLNMLSTKSGHKMVAQFMHKGGVINITIGGKTTTFNFNKEGERSNDKLLLISTPNSELNPEGKGNAGTPRDAVTSETEKNGNNEIGDDKNYDLRKGVSFNVFLEKELSEEKSTNALVHELTVHVDPNVGRLKEIESKIVDGTLKPGTTEYLKQLKSIQNSASKDHQNLGKGLNVNYMNLSAQLDKLLNTNQYTELYKKDVNDHK